MREIDVSVIEQTVRDLCIEANLNLTEDIKSAISVSAKQEKQPLARNILYSLGDNIEVAKDMSLPLCQDTGIAVVFAEVGQDVHITGGLISDAVNRGVARGYTEGRLRCSVVSDPFGRKNTNDNTPAVFHTVLIQGDLIKLTVSPKGFGSENMSRLKMFTPAAKAEDVVEFICETAKIAGGNACPPMVLGVGIGGNFELCAILAKRALCRPVDSENPDRFYAQMEQDALNAVNALGVGPQGMGGKTTALGVMIETYATHIAGLPVAVNVGCHVTRHASKIL